MVWRGAGSEGVVLKSADSGGMLKNSDIGTAAASLDVRLGRFQFTSIVLVSEYWLYSCDEAKPVLATGPAQTAYRQSSVLLLRGQ